jgi:hypothetical protein
MIKSEEEKSIFDKISMSSLTTGNDEFKLSLIVREILLNISVICILKL